MVLFYGSRQRLHTVAAAFFGLAVAYQNAFGGPPAHVVSDSSDAAKLFADFCLAGEPSLASLQSRARELEGAIAVDHTVPHGDKRHEHYQAWVVRRGNSMYQLTADEGEMAAGARRAVACGVTAPDADGADLARTMATELGLGAPYKRVPAIGVNGNSVVWKKYFGSLEAKIHLAYGAQGQIGSTIHLILPNLPFQTEHAK